ncbi:hypothetical protein AGMMS49574_15190 [Bacteroidia bacterium]|nr:hypothetical protein AGMMS49574_15190 [Bacteroidia bacterium]
MQVETEIDSTMSERLNPLNDYLFLKYLEEVIQMDTAIQKAQDRIAFVSNDEESLRAYQMREMALSDFTSGMNFARREGIAIGEQKGKIEVARSMKKDGMPVSQIVIYTNLSPDEIEQL